MSLDETLEKIFQAVDTDGSGQVDKQELQKMVVAVSEKLALTPEATDAITKVHVVMMSI